MDISVIFAMGNNRVIGIENRLPWRMPADLRYFKKITLGKPVVMGRLTFESLGCKALPGRENIVISSQQTYHAPGCVVASNLDMIFALPQIKNAPEIMVIGGASLFAQFLPLATRLYLTQIHADFPGDSYFPDFDLKDWQEISRDEHTADEKNPYPYTYLCLARRNNRKFLGNNATINQKNPTAIPSIN